MGFLTPLQITGSPTLRIPLSTYHEVPPSSIPTSYVVRDPSNAIIDVNIVVQSGSTYLVGSVGLAAATTLRRAFEMIDGLTDTTVLRQRLSALDSGIQPQTNIEGLRTQVKRALFSQWYFQNQQNILLYHDSAMLSGSTDNTFPPVSAQDVLGTRSDPSLAPLPPPPTSNTAFAPPRSPWGPSQVLAPPPVLTPPVATPPPIPVPPTPVTLPAVSGSSSTSIAPTAIRRLTPAELDDVSNILSHPANSEHFESDQVLQIRRILTNLSAATNFRANWNVPLFTSNARISRTEVLDYLDRRLLANVTLTTPEHDAIARDISALRTAIAIPVPIVPSVRPAPTGSTTSAFTPVATFTFMDRDISATPLITSSQSLALPNQPNYLGFVANSVLPNQSGSSNRWGTSGNQLVLTVPVYRNSGYSGRQNGEVLGLSQRFMVPGSPQVYCQLAFVYVNSEPPTGYPSDPAALAQSVVMALRTNIPQNNPFYSSFQHPPATDLSAFESNLRNYVGTAIMRHFNIASISDSPNFVAYPYARSLYGTYAPPTQEQQPQSIRDPAEARRVEQLINARVPGIRRTQRQIDLDIGEIPRELNAIDDLIRTASPTNLALARTRLAAIHNRIGTRDANGVVTQSGTIGSALETNRSTIAGVITQLDGLHATDAEKTPLTNLEGERQLRLVTLNGYRDRARELDIRAAPADAAAILRAANLAGPENLGGGAPHNTTNGGWAAAAQEAENLRQRQAEEQEIRRAIGRGVPSTDIDPIIQELIDAKHRVEARNSTLNALCQRINQIYQGNLTRPIVARLALYRSEIRTYVNRIENPPPPRP
ncbi:hypothetical protein HY990_02895 [Candidatus Micrarchaeota archaeon]|nr:hypothetical protein [Candidatus Micrarchaeota archaeon]